MNDDDRERLEDMVEHGRDAIELLGEMTPSDLEQDKRTRYAVIHCLEIVGEAASKVSPETRRAIDGTPWTRIVGMRNSLIHGYRDVNLSRVVGVVQDELPGLIATIEAALGEPDT
jgi:uncharacterized protein with HEPN domain